MRSYPRPLFEVPSRDVGYRHFAVSINFICYYYTVLTVPSGKYGVGYRILGLTKRRFRRGVLTSRVSARELAECRS